MSSSKFVAPDIRDNLYSRIGRREWRGKRQSQQFLQKEEKMIRRVEVEGSPLKELEINEVCG